MKRLSNLFVVFQAEDLRKASNCGREANAGDHLGGIPGVVEGVKQIESEIFNSVNSKYRFVTGNLVSGETGYISALSNGWETFGSLLQGIPDNGTLLNYYTPDVMVSFMR